jgi:hypothetical protein
MRCGRWISAFRRNLLPPSAAQTIEAHGPSKVGRKVFTVVSLEERFPKIYICLRLTVINYVRIFIKLWFI